MTPEETTLDRMRSRPRFKMYTRLSPYEYEDRLNTFLKANGDQFSGNINRESATIYVNNQQHTYWKPQLTLRAEKEDEKTAIRGVFGPSSSVWTFFMFLYSLFGVLWMVFFTMYFVEKQIKSNDYPWALTASFVMLFLVVLTYLASKFGQMKAKSEMETLRKFAIDSTLIHEEGTAAT